MVGSLLFAVDAKHARDGSESRNHMVGIMVSEDLTFSFDSCFALPLFRSSDSLDGLDGPTLHMNVYFSVQLSIQFFIFILITAYTYVLSFIITVFYE